MTEHSGRFVLRIPPDLHARSRRLARERGVSLNEYCRAAIEHYADRETGVPVESETGTWVSGAQHVLEDDLLAVVLFGSQARGEARASSDVDLLIVIADSHELGRDLYQRWDEEPLDDRVNPHFVHLPAVVRRAGSIWYEVALDGIVLFERDRLVSAFLQSVRREIADGRLQRRYAHGHPYWVKDEEKPRA